MSENIQNLINVWNKRPARVEPDDETHLLYVFTELLPALREAMPDVVNNAHLVSLAANPPILPLARDSNSQNIDVPPEPEPAPSSHTQPESLSEADTAAETGPAADTADMPASSPATAPLKPWQIAQAARAKKAAAKKLAAAPPAPPEGTAETGTV